jgi:hypothetical protein
MSDEQKPISSEEMIVRIASILKNGMKLGSMTEEEQKQYEANLIQHIADSPYYTAFYDAETKTIMVETTYFDPLLCIDVTNDSIYFLPLSEKGYYPAFIKIIEFIMLDRKRKKALMEEEQQEEEKPKEIPSFDFL